MALSREDSMATDDESIIQRKSNSTELTARPVVDTHVRAVRATQAELSTVISQLASSARIFTATSLQNGLIDGSISPEKAVAELMNIGSVDLDQLEKFNNQEVDKFIGKLKGVYPSLDTTTNVNFIENMLLLLDEWRIRYTDVGNVEDTTLADSFANEFDNMNVGNITASFIAEFIKATDTSFLAALPPSNDPGSLMVVGKLDGLRNNLDKLIEGPAQFAELAQQLRKLEPLGRHDFLLNSPQKKFTDLLDMFFSRKDELNDVKPGYANELTRIIEKVAKVAEETNCRQEMEILVAVSLSRTSAHFSNRTFTSGLAEGYKDIEKLPSDIGSLHVQTKLHGYDTQHLKSGLQPLQSLVSSAQAVDNQWEALSDDETKNAVRRVMEILEKYNNLGATKNAAKLDKLLLCANKPQTSSPDDYKELSALFRNWKTLRKLSKVVSSLPAELAKTALYSNSNELSNMRNAINFSKNPLNDAPGILDKIEKMSPDKMKTNIDDMKVQLKKLEEMMKVTNLFQNDLVQALTVDSNNITTVLAKQEIAFKDFFGCATSLSTEFASTASAVNIVYQLRELKKLPRLEDTMKKAASTMKSSNTKVQTLRKAVSSLKDNLNPEMKALLELSDLGKESNTVGESVIALENVSNVLAKKDQLEKLLEFGEGVEEEIENVNDPKLKSELEEGWGYFGKTKQEVRQMLDELEQKMNQTVVPVASRFADYGPLFVGFSNLKDVDLRVPKRRAVLEKLPTTTTIQGLDELKNSLDAVEHLDLHFSKFSIPLSKMPTSLSNIDSLFARMSAPVIVSTTTARGVMNLLSTLRNPVSIPSPVFTSTVRLPVMSDDTTTSGTSYTEWLIFGITAGVGGLCCAFLIYRNHRDHSIRKREALENQERYRKKLKEKFEEQQKKKEELEKEAANPSKQPVAPPIKPVVPPPEPVVPPPEPVVPPLEPVDPAMDLVAQIMKLYEKAKKLKLVKTEAPGEGKTSKDLCSQQYKFKKFLATFAWVQPTFTPDRFNKNDEYEAKKEEKTMSEFMNDRKQEYEALKLHTPFHDLVKLDPAFLGNKTRTLMAKWYNFQAGIVLYFSIELEERQSCRVRNSKLSFNPDNEAIAADHPDDWLDVSHVKFPLFGSAFVMQTPQTQDTKAGKEDTRTAFWKFMYERRCPYIVELGSCTEYFGTLKKPVVYGKYTVTVVFESIGTTTDIEWRTIAVFDEEDKTPHFLDHYKIPNWEKGAVPDPKKLADQLKLIHYIVRPEKNDQVKTPPYCVLSEHGRGRAGVFIGMEFIHQTLIDENTVEPNLFFILADMRSKRHGAVENGIQLYFMLCAGYALSKTLIFWGDDYPGHLDANFEAILRYSDYFAEENRKDRSEFKKFRVKKQDELNELKEAHTQEETELEVEKTPDTDKSFQAEKKNEFAPVGERLLPIAPSNTEGQKTGGNAAPNVQANETQMIAKNP